MRGKNIKIYDIVCFGSIVRTRKILVIDTDVVLEAASITCAV
jgi:predicted nucleotidyltransferase